MDQRGYELRDLTVKRGLTFEHLSDKIHPAQRDRVGAAFSATRAIVGPDEIDSKILAASASGGSQQAGRGAISLAERLMTGIFLDVADREQAKEGH